MHTAGTDTSLLYVHEREKKLVLSASADGRTRAYGRPAVGIHHKGPLNHNDQARRQLVTAHALEILTKSFTIR